MATLRFNCRICKNIQDHTNITEFNNLPPGLLVVECLGCGVMGVQLVDHEDTVNQL
jgi:hypothetical protein